MRIKIFGLFVCFLLVFTLVPTSGSMQFNNKDKPLYLQYTAAGWTEEIDGIKILHINGSHYEMGFQQGYFLKEECNQNLRGILNFAEPFISYEGLIEIWDEMDEYVPECYIEEMQGIADGSGANFTDVAASMMVFVWIDMIHCTGVAAWGNATKDGKLYHARSSDIFLNIQDPESGKYVHENSVIIIREPEDGFASISPSVAGSPHTGGGFNDQGIALGMQVCWSDDQKLQGMPHWLRVLQVLDYASNVDEAIEILTKNGTVGWNYIVSDAKIPIAYAIETSGNLSYVGTHNNSVESEYPFYEIDNAVRRTNFYINPELAETQRDNYNTKTLRSFIDLLKGKDFFFYLWHHYKAISQQIIKHWGRIDLNNTMDYQKRVYNGKTEIILFIFTILSRKMVAQTWNQWVADPISGDIIICFSSKDKNAYENPSHSLNFYELLNREYT